MRINFVMSNTVSSGIFDAIIKYFKEYLPLDCELFVTEYPLDNVDVYHYHRPNLEKELRSNSVVTVHHDLEDNDPWFDASQFIEKYHQADKIICLNRIQKNILLQQENLHNTVVIPHGINKKIFHSQKRDIPSGRKFNIGVVSKRYARRVKGEALLLELYKRLDSEHIKFYFIGDGRSQDKNEADLFGFESECHENLPYSLYDELYSEIDILLVPSLFEGGPANIPEALYTRTPILGRKIAMINDVIVQGKNGYFLTGNPELDANLINSLATNKSNIFTNLIDNLNNMTSQVLTWKEVVEKHLLVYKQILDEKDTNYV